MSHHNDLELEDGLKDIGNKLASPPFDLQQLLLLLDKAENLLSRVEQSPPASMVVALRPSMKALISKDLLGHSDIDVKVAIASCLSEITRITAPDAPYNDDLMKEIFGLIVGAFKNLDEMSSRSFPKRISVLETVVKVRSFVLMLDLDCDDLILEMFHHFLKTIRSAHSDTVFSSMEIVMTLVLEEAGSISSRLLSCILDCLKIVEKNILPAAKKLAEKVLVNCSLKLKPYLDELFNGNGALLSDYSKIVTAVFQGRNLDTSMQNETNVSGENQIQADNHKLSERILSDDLPQESAQQEGENFHPENAVAAAEKSSKSLMSNGSFQIGNGDSMVSKQKNEFHHHNGKSRVNTGATLVDSDILNSGTTKPDGRSNLSSHKGGKNALLKLSIINDHYEVGNMKEARVNSDRSKGSSKEAEIISQADGPSKKVKSQKKNELELTSDSPDVVASVSLHSPNEHDGTRPRRDRLSQSSGKRNDVDKAAADGLYSAGHKEILLTSQSKSMELPIIDLILKESEGLGDSEIKQPTGSIEKSRSGSAKDGKGNDAKDGKSTPITVTSDSDTELPSNRGRNGSQRKVRVNFSEKKQSAETEQQKGVKHPEADDKELKKLKELLFSQKSMVKELVKDHNHVRMPFLDGIAVFGNVVEDAPSSVSAKGNQQTFADSNNSFLNNQFVVLPDGDGGSPSSASERLRDFIRVLDKDRRQTVPCQDVGASENSPSMVSTVSRDVTVEDLPSRLIYDVEIFKNDIDCVISQLKFLSSQVDSLGAQVNLQAAHLASLNNQMSDWRTQSNPNPRYFEEFMCGQYLIGGEHVLRCLLGLKKITRED